MVNSRHVLLLAAIVTSVLAVAVLNRSAIEGVSAVVVPPRLPSGEVARVAPGQRPAWSYPDELQTASHVAFHALQGAGTGVISGILLLFMAWGPVRRGDRWGLAALTLSGLLAGALSAWAAQLFGPWHEDVALIAALCLASAALSGAGMLLKSREAGAAAGRSPVSLQIEAR